jgi:DNA-binding MarR family transcriptional regulator
MHVSVQSITPDVSKSQFDTLNCSLEELAVLKAVGENPHITQEALKTTIGKSISTVKRLTINLQKKGLLVRKNGKRDGYWVCTAREMN